MTNTVPPERSFTGVAANGWVGWNAGRLLPDSRDEKRNGGFGGRNGEKQTFLDGVRVASAQVS